MRLTNWMWGAALGAVIAAAGCAKEKTGEPSVSGEAGASADLILTNGDIKTPGGWAEAVAIDDGKIVAVGAAGDIEKFKGKDTKVVDLEGDTVLPGFHDNHVHPLFAGLKQFECTFEQGLALPEIQAFLKTCVDRAGPGEWIIGGQWDASAIGRIPDKAMLDAVTTEHPILLSDTSGHSAWVNSKALEIAGVTSQTPDPEGGIIERDASGEPTGVLRELAIVVVGSKAPPPSYEHVKIALTSAFNTMLSYGITSYTEASLGFAAGPEKELQAYADLSDESVLKQRIRLCITWHQDDASFDDVLASRNKYARERVSPDCVKILLDGVPTDSHTAAMLEPYVGGVADRDDEASRYGMLLVPQELLNEAVTRFDGMGLSVKFHAAGDAAVRAGLDAVEAARKANGPNGPLHDVGHCTFVEPSDMPRGKEINAVFEVSPYLWSPSPINDDITAAVGPDLIKRVWPIRELIDSGSLVVPGSDWAVVPSVNPWIAIESLVTRERMGGSEDSFGKQEAITLEEAIDLFTVESSKYIRAEKSLGKIEPGYLADLIVIDQNPYEVAATDLHKTNVLSTYVNGELVYSADQK
ncbi:MAG TPA: amidohydrolase [Parvularculaceae bacterium]|nr:amidohydrolase [Parvularculaceae bacterium]